MNTAEFISNAQKAIDENDFERAKKEVERIFMFDPENPTAKDLLNRIANVETSYGEVKVAEVSKEGFEKGLVLEDVKTEINKKIKTEDIVRSSEVSTKENKQEKKVSVKKLIKEGKKLYKSKRYYEALNKFEAVFVIDAQNERASYYIDKVKEAMAAEREAEHKKIQEEQREKIREKIEKYTGKIKTLQSQGKYTEAAILIEKGLLLDPTNKYLLAIKKLNENGVKEQLSLEKSSQEKVKNIVNRAVKEYIQGNYFEAKKYFEQVLEISPDDIKAKNSVEKIEAKISKLGLEKK